MPRQRNRFAVVWILALLASSALSEIRSSSSSDDHHHSSNTEPLEKAAERTVHLLWGLWDDGPLPKAWANNVARWTELNPTWQTRLWHRVDCERLVNTTTEWREIYFSARPIQRADLVRLMIIFTYGGLYADLDVVPKLPLQSAFTAFGFFDGTINDGSGKASRSRGGVVHHFSEALFVETQLPAWYSVETSRWPIRGGVGEVRVRVANFLFWARAGSPLIARALNLASTRLSTLRKNSQSDGNLNRYSNSEYAIIYSSGPDILSEAAMRGSDGRDVGEHVSASGKMRAVDRNTLLIPLLEFAPFAFHEHAGSWEGQGNSAVAAPEGALSGAEDYSEFAWGERKIYTLRLGRFTVKVDSLAELLDTFTASVATEIIGGGFYYYLRTAIRKLRDETTTQGFPPFGNETQGQRSTDNGASERQSEDTRTWFIRPLVSAYDKLAFYDAEVPGRARHELGKVFKALGMPKAALQALHGAVQDAQGTTIASADPLLPYRNFHDLWYDIAQMHLATVKDETSPLSAPALNLAVQALEKAIAHAPPASTIRRTKDVKDSPIDRYRRSLTVAREIQRRLDLQLNSALASSSETEQGRESSRESYRTPRQDL